MAVSKESIAGAPECGLYIRIPSDFEFEDIVARLRGVFFITTRSDYERNMHVLELPTPRPEEGAVEEVRGLAEFARKSGFVCILRGPVVMAGTLQVDGVLLEKGADIAATRKMVGDDAIIGIRCGLDRDAADAAVTAGADYVSFHAASEKVLIPPDILSWWSTKSEIPALVEGPITNDDCGAYVRAGASFIDCGDFILDHPKTVTQGAVDMMYAIDLALGNKVIN